MRPSEDETPLKQVSRPLSGLRNSINNGLYTFSKMCALFHHCVELCQQLGSKLPRCWQILLVMKKVRTFSRTYIDHHLLSHS